MAVYYVQAYKNFGARVANLKKKLEDYKNTLPSPVQSPEIDAPSPGNTPPGVKDALDHVGSVDMDLSDDDSPPMMERGELLGSRFNIKMVFPGLGIPIIMIRHLYDCLIFVMRIPQ